jgi:hypothetical protein
MIMRVAFNATPLLSPLTGIGKYIVELSAALTATGDVDPTRSTDIAGGTNRRVHPRI